MPAYPVAFDNSALLVVSVNIIFMGNLNDLYNNFLTPNLKHDPVQALPDSITLLSRILFCTLHLLGLQLMHLSFLGYV